MKLEKREKSMFYVANIQRQLSIFLSKKKESSTRTKTSAMLSIKSSGDSKMTSMTF